MLLIAPSEKEQVKQMLFIDNPRAFSRGGFIPRDNIDSTNG